MVGKGEISSFAALCTALSATIGTGNIVGVATAIGVLSGGPGAPLWWIAALLVYDKVFRRVFLLSNTDVWTLTDKFMVDHSIT